MLALPFRQPLIGDLQGGPELAVDPVKGLEILLDLRLFARQFDLEALVAAEGALGQQLMLCDMLQKLLQGTLILVAIFLPLAEADVVIDLFDGEKEQHGNRQAESKTDHGQFLPYLEVLQHGHPPALLRLCLPAPCYTMALRFSATSS